MVNSIEVNGLEIKANALYKIVDKTDNNALDGLREYGSTKYPQEFIGNSIQCPYDSQTDTYDTGFYIQSPCYRGLDLSTREKLVNILKDLIVDPYERVYGIDILDNKNIDFWSNFDIHLDEGRIFNTSSVKDRLELYIAMRGFELTPRSMLGDPRFVTSQFMIEDREVSNKRRSERDQNFMVAMKNFFIMLSSEKHKLIATLKYCNMSGADSFDNDTPESTLNALFKDWIDKEVSNVDKFLRASTMANKKMGMEEITLYSLLLELKKSNKLIRIGDEFAYNEVPLGADLKTCAKNLQSKKSLKDIKDEIIKAETE